MEKCKYCQEGVPLITGPTNDRGVALKYPDKLIAYGYDIHGFGSNGFVIPINYCPICGRKINNEKGGKINE